MKRLLTFAAATIACIPAAGLSLAAAGAKLQDIQVTTTIADLAGEAALRVQSDRQGAYTTTTVNRTTYVRSMLLTHRTGHDWILTTYYYGRRGLLPTNRTVFFDLREQVNTGAFATPLLGTDVNGAQVEFGQVTAHLTAKCSQAGVDMVQMAAGSTVQCPGTMRFQAPDGSWYRLSFQPANYPQVDPYAVTCTAADSTGCKVWSIAPSGTALTGTDPNAKSLNKLLLIDEGGTILAEGGVYYLSFSITVVR